MASGRHGNGFGGAVALAMASILLGVLPGAAVAQEERRESRRRPEPPSAPMPVQPVPENAEAPVIPSIMPVLTEREKRCRQQRGCAMSGPCPACPR